MHALVDLYRYVWAILSTANGLVEQVCQLLCCMKYDVVDTKIVGKLTCKDLFTTILVIEDFQVDLYFCPLTA